MIYPDDFVNKIICGDCLEVMKDIPDKSIDMILCDLPYGTTACKWDTIIPFELLWKCYKRICKDNTPILLFGTEPFSSKLRMSNLSWYKFDWIWNKVSKKGHLVCKIRPLQQTENISVFCHKKANYFPQMIPRITSISIKEGSKTVIMGGKGEYSHYRSVRTDFYPSNLLVFPTGADKNKFHSTQKPVELCEYLIKTYTQEGDLVLDNCIGSGTTAIACYNTNRRYIGIELFEDYCKIARQRLKI